MRADSRQALSGNILRVGDEHVCGRDRNRYLCL